MCNRTGFSRRDLLIVVLILAALSALIVPAILQATEAARESVCLGRMSQLKHALWLFENTKGHFPPAIFLSEEGNAQHSWRVLILPYVSGDGAYDQYRFQESWNSAHNLAVMDNSAGEFFQCPNTTGGQFTSYVVVRGTKTAFPPDGPLTRKDITDGLENTATIVEAHDPKIDWREPRDLEYDAMVFKINMPGKPCINSTHTKGPGIIFADKSYSRLSSTLAESDIRALLTRAAGDSPKKAELDRGDGTLGH